MDGLEKKLGYTFKDKSLLTTALTHSSYANEKRREGVCCNERLEFLGDSVLGMSVARHLYHSCPELSEGPMTRLRAELVCEQSLHGVAMALDLGRHLLLGRGEEQGGGRARPSILADAVEAVLAAVLLDGGQAEVDKIVERFITGADAPGRARVNRDYKTELQELVQKKSSQTLSYSLLEELGPDHDKSFRAQAVLNGVPIGEGLGRNKKEAEQMAAKSALERGLA